MGFMNVLTISFKEAPGHSDSRAEASVRIAQLAQVCQARPVNPRLLQIGPRHRIIQVDSQVDSKNKRLLIAPLTVFFNGPFVSACDASASIHAIDIVNASMASNQKG
jgi:hypothetical protein